VRNIEFAVDNNIRNRLKVRVAFRLLVVCELTEAVRTPAVELTVLAD
jgi:hypothetical protein